MNNRYLINPILDDLNKKMVFLSGPRQVGKTTLANMIAEINGYPYDYMNWDDSSDKKRILHLSFLNNPKLLIFDEVHKYKMWKNHIKGLFDKHKDNYKIMVTGSARLDIFQKGGDSMLGRYFSYRLHPFSLAEILAPEKINSLIPGKEINIESYPTAFSENMEVLLKFGGFPEPFLSQNERTLRRWNNARSDRLIREDIRDIESLHDISKLQVLIELILPKVGSLCPINSLREDLQVTHKTAGDWLDILERFYFHFRIYPYASTTFRSLRKEPKIYLWDWSEVENEGAKLENMVASHLLKTCHFLYDHDGYKVELRFLRDLEGRETDFIVLENGKPWFAVEVKTSDQKTSKNLLYFGKKLNIPYLFQVVRTPGIDTIQDGVRLLSVDKLLAALI